MIQKSDLQAWFNAAERGATFIYHSGLLLAERGTENAATDREAEVDNTARLAWELCENNKVTLTQHRIGELAPDPRPRPQIWNYTSDGYVYDKRTGEFEYIAVKL